MRDPHYDVGQEQQPEEHSQPAVMMGDNNNHDNDDLDDEIIQDHKAPLCTRTRMKCLTWTSVAVALICLCIVVPVAVVSSRKAVNNAMSLQQQTLLGQAWTPLGNDIVNTKDFNGCQEFGESVALSANGMRLAIGANQGGTDNEGKVIIKKFVGSYWKTMGELQGGRAELNFGHAVQLSADGNVVLASGFADESTKGLVQSYRYQWEKHEWVQFGSDVTSRSQGDRFGVSISMNADGTSFVVGADGRDDDPVRNGAAFVYGLSSNTLEWIPKGKTFMGVNGSRMGYAVAMSGDGDTICIGERDYKLETSGRQRGRVLCHYWNSDINEWIVKSKSPKGIRGRRNGGNFGYSLALNYAGTRLAVGNRLGNANDSGSVTVYEYNMKSSNGEWDKMGDEISSGQGDDQGGFQVDLNDKGDVLAWTARGYDEDNQKNVGIVRTAQFSSNGKWNELGEGISGENAGDYFGESVALSSDGTIFAASSNWNDDNEYVMVFQNSGGRSLLRR